VHQPAKNNVINVINVINVFDIHVKDNLTVNLKKNLNTPEIAEKLL
jgi:hypothetical protein